jgi:type I restriction enzyme M protein
MPNVSNLIKTIQDIMRKDAGVDGDAQRLAQLGWMFFFENLRRPRDPVGALR